MNDTEVGGATRSTFSVYFHIYITQVLWEREREELGLTEKQSFIDLGCGNGLLVYLLTAEGVIRTCPYNLYFVYSISPSSIQEKA